MKVSVLKEDVKKIYTDILAVFLFQQEKPIGKISDVDKMLKGEISNLIKFKGFEGKLNENKLILTADQKIKAVVLVGLGEEKKFTLDKFRQASASANLSTKNFNMKSLSILLRKAGNFSIPELARVSVEGSILANYNFERFKTDEKDKKEVEELTLISDSISVELKEKVERSRIYAEAVNYMRDLANVPANVATPTYIVKEAQRLVKGKNIEIKFFEKTDLEKLGFGGILAVSRGSMEPPKFLILNYKPKNAKKRIVLIGKGITFDSGGISLKPAADMHKMKFDKSGACAVLSILKAAAEAKFPFELIGLMPLTENLPGGSATKPGDVIKPYKGKSVEVVDTDAEGRLILADALSYAQEYKPDIVIDFATLTGSCVVALGRVAIGMFGNDDKIKNLLKKAANMSGEKIWELPLFEEYEIHNESEVADIKNLGRTGEAGAISAAKFLESFVKDYPWIHLDIAGPAYDRENDRIPYYGKGSTGCSVRLLCYLLENLA